MSVPTTETATEPRQPRRLEKNANTRLNRKPLSSTPHLFRTRETPGKIQDLEAALADHANEIVPWFHSSSRPRFMGVRRQSVLRLFFSLWNETQIAASFQAGDFYLAVRFFGQLTRATVLLVLECHSVLAARNRFQSPGRVDGKETGVYQSKS